MVLAAHAVLECNFPRWWCSSGNSGDRAHAGCARRVHGHSEQPHAAQQPPLALRATDLVPHAAHGRHVEAALHQHVPAVARRPALLVVQVRRLRLVPAVAAPAAAALAAAAAAARPVPLRAARRLEPAGLLAVVQAQGLPHLVQVQDVRGLHAAASAAAGAAAAATDPVASAAAAVAAGRRVPLGHRRRLERRAVRAVVLSQGAASRAALRALQVPGVPVVHDAAALRVHARHARPDQRPLLLLPVGRHRLRPGVRRRLPELWRPV